MQFELAGPVLGVEVNDYQPAGSVDTGAVYCFGRINGGATLHNLFCSRFAAYSANTAKHRIQAHQPATSFLLLVLLVTYCQPVEAGH
ncbi:hypothetical protein BJP05_00180 [Corynebacterium sp. NML98-0116]|nr:hypothetical protein BJP05_00180 [Corynebacterium sp. NML98-0116]